MCLGRPETLDRAVREGINNVAGTSTESRPLSNSAASGETRGRIRVEERERRLGFEKNAFLRQVADGHAGQFIRLSVCRKPR